MASSLFAFVPNPASSFSLLDDGAVLLSPSDVQPFSLNGRTPFLSLASFVKPTDRPVEPSFEHWDGVSPVIEAVKPTSTIVRSSSADLDSFFSFESSCGEVDDSHTIRFTGSDSSSIADSEPSFLFDDSFTFSSSSSTSSRASSPEPVELSGDVGVLSAPDVDANCVAEPRMSHEEYWRRYGLCEPQPHHPSLADIAKSAIINLATPYADVPARAVSRASSYTPFFRTPEEVTSLALSARAYVPFL
ncbi:hypothetical protein JCM8097_006982 [Rhodosporidiobolus ruineniae]